jgi:UDP-GlcNAc:undecaprenyl-phosphate/decaprenyl-phosphate GlcNAc-1-phosphate transferase
MGPYVAVFLASAGTVLVLTPLVRLAARKAGAIDHPSDRKVHPKPTPTLGGVGVLLGVLAGFGVAYLTPEFRPIFLRSSELQGTLLAVCVIFAIGVVDDLRALSAPAKAAGQVLAAGLLVLNGVQLLFFWFPTQGVISLGADLAVPLTVAWVLVMVNALNLIDGLDGLAAGIAAIAAGAFFIYAFQGPTNFDEPIPTAAVLCAVAAGAAVGFLPYNFYPARIFMGDSGAMPLGLLLAAATISGVGQTIQPSGGDIAAFSIPVLIPVIVLAVPLADVALAIFRRLRRGRPVFAPDKEHIHHQLREIGHTHRQAVLLMYFWSTLLAGSALAITFLNGRALVGSVVGTSLLLIGATLIPRRVRESRRVRRLAAARSEGVPEPSVGTKPV